MMFDAFGMPIEIGMRVATIPERYTAEPRTLVIGIIEKITPKGVMVRMETSGLPQFRYPKGVVVE